MRWDVVVFRTIDTYQRPDDAFFGDDAPIIARIDLGHDLFIERLDATVTREVSRRCTPGGVDTAIAQRYSFVRSFPEGADPQDFDEDERLQIALALSRLVHPTSIGLEESAQVWGPLVSPPRLRVKPGPITGPASAAYVVDTTRPDWLTPADASELRVLLHSYFDGPQLPVRVRNGLWHHEFAARSSDMAARWTSVVTGLEALFNTDRDFVTRQIKGRCAAVAAQVGIPLTARQAGEAYQLRSSLSHGSLTRVDPNTRELYILIEAVLRESLRCALRDPAWEARFTDSAAVRTTWPIDMPTECPTCGQGLPATE